LTVEIELDASGEWRGVGFHRSLIVSDHRLTYGFVDELLAGHGVVAPPEHLPGEPPRSAGEDVAAETAATEAAATEAARTAGAEAPASAPAAARAVVEGATFHADAALTDHLLLAWELADILRRRRFAHGALRIGSFEPEYRFDGSGRLIGASSRPETPSHALVEEYMLAANQAVARYLVAQKAHTIFRVHEPPDAAAAEGLMAAFDELNVPTPPFPEGQRASAEQVAGAFRGLSDLLPRFCAREQRGLLAFPQLLLRSLKQARYGPQNLGHFGLASSAYLHFTSPIRRYPDLVVHRALCARLGLDGEELPEGALGAVAEECSQQERAIARLELKADDVALSFLLERRLGEIGWETTFDGEIVGLIGAGVFVHFGGTYQGFVPVRRLGDERFYESPTGASLIGVSTGKRYRMGDAIRVTVERIEKARGRVTLDLAGHAGDTLKRDRQAAPRDLGGPSHGRSNRPSPRRQAGRRRSTRRGRR
jgi:VacB/RNase II family 3'-5' exoribonuclease